MKTERVSLQSFCLIITAVPVSSGYSMVDQSNPENASFVTRHLANCCFSMVDEAAIPYLGYLPQDMEGSDIFAYYHPQDLPYLKEVYESIMTDQSKPIRLRPYRFKVRNGCYVLIETDWSCFVNPWSKKLEFVIGQHTILKGPSNVDVFTTMSAEDDEQHRAVTSASTAAEAGDDNSKNKCKVAQDEIRMMLKETVSRSQSALGVTGDPLRVTSTRRRKKLASFMGTLLEEMTRAETTKAPSTSGHTSVLGNISPHHEDTGSESPPSYNTLNYNDNLARFFNSQPKTLTEKEASAIENSSVFDECKTLSGQALNDSSSGSRVMRSGSPAFDTNSESGNGGSNSKMKQTRGGGGNEGDSRGDSRGESRGASATGTTSKDTHHHQGQSGSGGGGGGGGGSGNKSHEGSGGDSGENPLSGGTSGGVSAAANAICKRIHTHVYGHHGGSGSGDGSGSGGNGSHGSMYKPPVLTEQLLQVHNRGEEKKMIESYKDSKKGELRFLKNRLKSARAAHQHALKKSINQHLLHHHHHGHHQYHHHQATHHRQFGAAAAAAAALAASAGGLPEGGPSNAIQLWPPFSVANTGLSVVKPHQVLAPTAIRAGGAGGAVGVGGNGNQAAPGPSGMSGVASVAGVGVPGTSSQAASQGGSSQQPQPGQPGPSSQPQSVSQMAAAAAAQAQQRGAPLNQAMYSNLIPAYYIPAQMSSNQRSPTGGYFVQVPTTFIQQPLQVRQTIRQLLTDFHKFFSACPCDPGLADALPAH